MFKIPRIACEADSLHVRQASFDALRLLRMTESLYGAKKIPSF